MDQDKLAEIKKSKKTTEYKKGYLLVTFMIEMQY